MVLIYGNINQVFKLKDFMVSISFLIFHVLGFMTKEPREYYVTIT